MSADAGGRQARGRGEWQAGHRRTGRARQAGTGRAGHGRWACGLARAVHLVHLACFLARFDSVLFLSQFLDIVREPGS